MARHQPVRRRDIAMLQQRLDRSISPSAQQWKAGDFLQVAPQAILRGDKGGKSGGGAGLHLGGGGGFHFGS